MRAPSRWVAPRRRHRRRMGPREITWHAVDSYLLRHPDASRKDAIGQLDELCDRAYFIGRTPTGEELYKADGCRLVVHRPARRPAIVLTVLPASRAPGEGGASVNAAPVKVLVVELPLPPSVNHSHDLVKARARNGRTFTRRVPSAATKGWRSEAYLATRKAITAADWRPICCGKAVVELTYFWPDRRRRDTHNRIKELMDVLAVAGVFADDCQALAREQDFCIDSSRPRVELRVWEVGS